MNLVFYAKEPHHQSAQRCGARGAPPPEGYPWEEVSFEPHGAWYSVHPYLERRDAMQVFRHAVTGAVVRHHVRNYYVRISAAAPQGHDICLYCGADNGPDGAGREGGDCHLCGGN